jgi:hypothetical protein
MSTVDSQASGAIGKARRAVDRVRDEEVVGSNPATPTAVRPGQGPDPRNWIRPLSGFLGRLGSQLHPFRAPAGCVGSRALEWITTRVGNNARKRAARRMAEAEGMADTDALRRLADTGEARMSISPQHADRPCLPDCPEQSPLNDDIPPWNSRVVRLTSPMRIAVSTWAIHTRSRASSSSPRAVTTLRSTATSWTRTP